MSSFSPYLSIRTVSIHDFEIILKKVRLVFLSGLKQQGTKVLFKFPTTKEKFPTRHQSTILTFYFLPTVHFLK